jgi:hypothetical protein
LISVATYGHFRQRLIFFATAWSFCLLIAFPEISLAFSPRDIVQQQLKCDLIQLKNWRTGIYRIEVLNGTGVGVNKTHAPFTFKILEIIRPSYIDSNKFQAGKILDGLWIATPTFEIGKIHPFADDLWLQRPIYSPPAGIKILAFTGPFITPHWGLTQDSAFADTSENAAIAVKCMASKSIQEIAFDYSLHLAVFLILIAIALLMLKRPSVCLVFVSFTGLVLAYHELNIDQRIYYFGQIISWPLILITAITGGIAWRKIIATKNLSN